MENKYNKQAKEFLSKYELNLSIREAIPQKTPLWINKDSKNQQHGINYFCSLSNKDGKHYSFDFWGSIADAEKISHGEKTGRPNAYSILACLDTYSDGESFEDFCNNFGYDTDSITAEKTYKAVMKQIDGLKAILTPEAIEELNNIN
jgi:hypothetical protein